MSLQTLRSICSFDNSWSELQISLPSLHDFVLYFFFDFDLN